MNINYLSYLIEIIKDASRNTDNKYGIIFAFFYTELSL